MMTKTIIEIHRVDGDDDNGDLRRIIEVQTGNSHRAILSIRVDDSLIGGLKFQYGDPRLQ